MGIASWGLFFAIFRARFKFDFFASNLHVKYLKKYSNIRKYFNTTSHSSRFTFPELKPSRVDSLGSSGKDILTLVSFFSPCVALYPRSLALPCWAVLGWFGLVSLSAHSSSGASQPTEAPVSRCLSDALCWPGCVIGSDGLGSLKPSLRTASRALVCLVQLQSKNWD